MICEVYEGDQADVDIAVQKAIDAFQVWSKISCTEKSNYLYKIYQVISDLFIN